MRRVRLPFHAPPFDKIKDEDYQPAIEAGMAEQLAEMQAIADNPATPTFENTLVAMEKTGQLLQRAMAGVRCGQPGEYQSRAAEVTRRRGAEASGPLRCHLPKRKMFCSRGCPSTNSASRSVSIRNRCVCLRSPSKSSSAPAQIFRMTTKPN